MYGFVRTFVALFVSILMLNLLAGPVSDVRAESANPEDYAERAANGDLNAQIALGTMYYTGKGLPQNYGEALKWFRRAADQGSSAAMHNLGEMYLSGPRGGQGLQRGGQVVPHGSGGWIRLVRIQSG